mgnify:CR=1 FL=1
MPQMPRIKISPQSMTRAVSGLDRMINRIPRRTQQTIKSLFVLLVLGGSVGAFIWGAVKGREAAEIKSAPIVSSTNEVFDVDIKRENEGGNFSALLDSEVINEMKSIEAEKMRFPTKTNLEPETDRGIVEPDFGRKTRESTEVRNPEPLIEGDYRPGGGPAADVRPVEKRGGASVELPETVVDAEKGGIEKLPERETGRKPDTTFRRDTDVRQLEKKKPVRGADIREPAPVDREGGIIKD